MEVYLTNIIQFPEKDRAMRTYRVTMTEEYVIELQAFDEHEAAEDAEKMVGDCPEDYCLGGIIKVERVD